MRGEEDGRNNFKKWGSCINGVIEFINHACRMVDNLVADTSMVYYITHIRGDMCYVSSKVVSKEGKLVLRRGETTGSKISQNCIT